MHLRKNALVSTKLDNAHMDVWEFVVFENKFLWKIVSL
jgi:hypothetical protein